MVLHKIPVPALPCKKHLLHLQEGDDFRYGLKVAQQEVPPKKKVDEADALTNVDLGDFDSFGGGSQLWTQWTSFQGDVDSRQDVDAGSPSLSILPPHQASVSNNDAVRQLEVDSPTTINSTSLHGSTPSTPTLLSSYTRTCSDKDVDVNDAELQSSLGDPRAEEDMSAPSPTPAAVWLDCHRCRGKLCVLATGYYSVCGERSSLWKNCTSCRHTRCVLLFCAICGRKGGQA